MSAKKNTQRVPIAEVQEEYPNNGFISYWNHLRNVESGYKKGIWRWLYALFTMFSRILKDAGIELSFLLIFGAIIMYMGQGRDLVVSLFEPDNIYTKWRIFWTVMSAVSLSVAMWIVPAFLFQYRDKLNKRNGYKSVFKRHMFFAHRVLPLVPFWLLASVLFNGPGTIWLFMALSFLQLLLLAFFHRKMTDKILRWLWFTFITILLIAGSIYFNNIFEKTYNEAKITLAVILYLVAFLLHFLFHEMDLKIIREHQRSVNDDRPSFTRHLLNSSIYTFVWAIHITLTILFFIDYDLHLAPESMMLYIFSLYVFIIDLIIYTINLKPQGKLIATTVLIILIVLYATPVLNFNVSHYSLDSFTSAKSESGVLGDDGRFSFEQRYRILKDKIDSNKTGQPYPIILVSGEGGGSRAGFWLSQNIINFDYYTKGRFREHIFSLSTVSGSSVGLSTLFTYWELTKDTSEVNSAWLEFPEKVYANNFVGNSVKGMLLTDFWKSIIPRGEYVTDRNSLLQDEESYYTQLAANKILTRDSSNDEPDIDVKDRILCKDFMDFFYERDPETKKLKIADKPLVFINSCRSNDGRRSIVSPIRLTDSVFNDAIDIAGFMYENTTCKSKEKEKCKNHRNRLSFGQACNLSELFPGFSAPAYIDSLGSFVDGGYHENSGLKTTLDVYTNLREALERDTLLGKCEIYILYFKNGGGEKNLYKHTKSDLPIKLPLKALTSQPFEGSASYFEEKARYVNGLRFFSIRLNNEIIKNLNDFTSTSLNTASRKIEKEILDDLRTEPTDTTLQFPLARWLSKSVIKRMRLATFPVKVNPTEDDDRVHCLLQKINAFHSFARDHGDLKPFWEWSPKSKILLEQQGTKCDFSEIKIKLDTPADSVRIKMGKGKLY